MIRIPVSVGELIDKITILTIKQERITDPKKLKNINHELELLNKEFGDIPYTDVKNLMSSQLIDQLKTVNNQLWDIENYKRAMEKDQNFGEGFINAARQVYLKNDERARIKGEINELTKSPIKEEKEHNYK